MPQFVIAAIGIVANGLTNTWPDFSGQIEHLSLIVSLVAFVVSIFALNASRRRANAAEFTMYRDHNNWLSDDKEYNVVGPLTPYKYLDEDERYMLKHLLRRFNRFQYTGDRKSRKRHIAFVNKTMGCGLAQFKEKIRDRMKEQPSAKANELADKAVKVLLSIKANEPYFSQKFRCGFLWRKKNNMWDIYFNGFKFE